MQAARGVHGDLYMQSLSSIQWFFNNAVEKDEGLYRMVLDHSRFDNDGPFLTAAQHAGFAPPPDNSLKPPLHRRMLALSTPLPHSDGAGIWDDIVPALPSLDQLSCLDRQPQYQPYALTTRTDPLPYLLKTYQLPSSDPSTQVTPKTSPDTRKKPSYTYPIKLRNVPKPQLASTTPTTQYRMVPHPSLTSLRLRDPPGPPRKPSKGHHLAVLATTRSFPSSVAVLVAPFELQPAPSTLQHKPSHTKTYPKTYFDPGLTPADFGLGAVDATVPLFMPEQESPTSPSPPPPSPTLPPLFRSIANLAIDLTGDDDELYETGEVPSGSVIEAEEVGTVTSERIPKNEPL
ncbi:hypothetical protein C8R41DRAFT_916083 [Lentinula lateritia]|uniref:Uncharacterized protein n=1 Tax=Lentinula lateritia TaxID=40482 RepID=A0ABQ8VRI3_9AGAR|nr:hypothetical protein C8R41DRAFT_916083 [Lentinula lateritia]